MAKLNHQSGTAFWYHKNPIVFTIGDFKHKGFQYHWTLYRFQAIEQNDHGRSLSNAHGAESS